jgi:hypothetical protein
MKNGRTLLKNQSNYDATSSANSVHVQCVMSLTKDYFPAVTTSGMEDVQILIVDVEE